MKVFAHQAMDTDFTVRFAGGDEALFGSAANACFLRIDEIEARLSRFRDDSDVAVVRALRPGEVAVVSTEFMDALLVSAQVCAATRGAFDPTLGDAMDFVRSRKAVDDGDESAATLAKALEWTGMGRLVLDPDRLRVAVKRPEGAGEGEWRRVALDFGGIGKGYALDECAKILTSEQYELHNWLLDGGTSTLLASGSPGLDAEGWPLGVGGSWKGRTRRQTTLRLSSGALSGSGFELRGEHVRDVRRGGPAVRWAQSWCRASSATVADALSTALLAMDSKEIAVACRELGAWALVARSQGRFADRFRDPLVEFGEL